MPVHAHQIPLETAKSWAKRLTKTSKSLFPNAPWKLSQSQAALAQMLGFKDWHDLEQGLTKPVSLQTRDAYFFYQGSLPTDSDTWKALWRETLAKASDVHLEHRPREAEGALRIRMRMMGRLVEFMELKGADARLALQSLFEGESNITTDKLLSGSILDYVSGVLPLQPLHNRGSYRYQSLPVYPSGWDIVIRQEGKSESLTLDAMEFPPELMEALSRIRRKPHGAVLFTGTAGSGKSTLMTAMVKQAYTESILKREKKTGPLKTAVIESPSLALSLPHATHFNATTDTEKGYLASMRSNPDLVVMDEMRNREQGEILKTILQNGFRLWSTANASGGLMSAIERLEDFVPDHDWSASHGLSGWTYSRLLPVLCRYCSQKSGQGNERIPGHGCGHCGMLGVSRRQMVVGVWEMAEGEPTLLFSHLDQARDLVKEGRVSRKDAEDALGPLSQP